MSAPGKISRSDIEAKVREIQERTSGDASEARSVGLAFVVAAGFVALGIAYAIGRRAGRKRSMVVEIRSK